MHFRRTIISSTWCKNVEASWLLTAASEASCSTLGAHGSASKPNVNLTASVCTPASTCDWMNPLTPPSTPRYRAWRNHLWCTHHSQWRRSCRCIRLISWDRCRWPILSAVVHCYNRQRYGMRWACPGRPSILPWWACNGRAIRQRVSWAMHASINSLAPGRFQFNFR